MGPSSAKCVDKKKKSLPAGGIFENAKRYIDHIVSVRKKNVVVVANMGLWYNDKRLGGEHVEIHDKTVFVDALPHILDWLQSLSSNKDRNNIIAWHETMSQHWKSDSGNILYSTFNHFSSFYLLINIALLGSGYFDSLLVDHQELQYPYKHPETLPIEYIIVPNCCSQITDFSDHLDWRNNEVKKLLNEAKHRDVPPQNKIQLLPFRKITEPIADMHTCHQLYKHDCTHYCYWPLLWQPFWHQLYHLTKERFK